VLFSTNNRSWSTVLSNFSTKSVVIAHTYGIVAIENQSVLRNSFLVLSIICVWSTIKCKNMSFTMSETPLFIEWQHVLSYFSAVVYGVKNGRCHIKVLTSKAYTLNANLCVLHYIFNNWKVGSLSSYGNLSNMPNFSSIYECT